MSVVFMGDEPVSRMRTLRYRIRLADSQYAKVPYESRKPGTHDLPTFFPSTM